MDKVDSFLERHSLLASSVDDESVLSFILSEMDKGLKGEESSLEMIDAFVGTDVQIKPGESVIVLDAGGTNFRTCLVTFDEDRKPVISDFRKVGMPGVKEEVSKEQFFSILAILPAVRLLECNVAVILYHIFAYLTHDTGVPRHSADLRQGYAIIIERCNLLRAVEVLVLELHDYLVLCIGQDPPPGQVLTLSQYKPLTHWH